MNRTLALGYWIALTLCFTLSAYGSEDYDSMFDNEPSSGVQLLSERPQEELNSLVNTGTWPLIRHDVLESFLADLEVSPPNWATLHDREGEEHGAQLFAFNRMRDKKRQNHPYLKQRIAFLWSGILTKYDLKRGGFTIAIGPEFTHTSWGIVRFKPMGLPDEMVVVPSPYLRRSFRKEIQKGEKIEVAVLFIGQLVPDESIMYAFSHEDPDVGMIMPVVKIEKVQYFLKPSPR